MKDALFRPALTLLLLAVWVAALFPQQAASAQAEGAYYIAREGDSLTIVSRYFHVAPTNHAHNPIADPDLLTPGRKL